jgi:hypothetical protein
MVMLTKVKGQFADGWPAWIECDEGWYNLIEATHYAILEVDPDYKINQIKEKFGGLRYYIEGNEAAHDIAWKAEDISCGICEVCGATGVTRNKGGWYKTTCEAHK